MTAKELKEQALTEPLHLASYYRFNEKQLKDFCQQLCKEQRDKHPIVKDIHGKAIDYAEEQWKNGLGDDNLKRYAKDDFIAGANWAIIEMLNAPMPEL